MGWGGRCAGCAACNLHAHNPIRCAHVRSNTCRNEHSRTLSSPHASGAHMQVHVHVHIASGMCILHIWHVHVHMHVHTACALACACAHCMPRICACACTHEIGELKEAVLESDAVHAAAARVSAVTRYFFCPLSVGGEVGVVRVVIVRPEQLVICPHHTRETLRG